MSSTNQINGLIFAPIFRLIKGAIVHTINGKLVSQERQQLYSLQQATSEIQERFDDLELQMQLIQGERETIDLEDIGLVKDYLHTLDNRLDSLENTMLNQAKKLLLLNISGFVGLVGLSICFGINNQLTYHNNTLEQRTESMGIVETTVNN